MSTVIVNRATSIYVIMVFVLVGGLWVIFSFGSTLRPATDLAGKWELVSADGTMEINVEQSGRYVHVATPRWQRDFKIVRDTTQNPISGEVVKGNGDDIRLVGGDITITFGVIGVDDQCELQVDGPYAGRYQAKRTVRTYPRLEAPSTRPAGPSSP